MKITPIEIRQKSFEKKLRGYDKEEVSAFLLSLSNEWERVLDENKENKIKLDQALKEVEKLREVENSLFKTLKTAEDTGANLVEQANKAAELHLKETQMNAEAILSESKNKARGIIERAELQAKEMIEEMQEALKDLEKNYQSLENQRDNLVAELKNLASDVLDRLGRTTKPSTTFQVEDHMKRVRDMVRDSEARIREQQLETPSFKTAKIPELDPRAKDNAEQLQNFIAAKSADQEPDAPADDVSAKAPEASSETEPLKNGAHPPRETKSPMTDPSVVEQREEDEEQGGSFFDSL
ncbi:MAG: DivIVA domain-containing protein [Bacteroidota bacterium]